MSQELTIIYRGWRLQEAYLLRNLLVEHGLPAVVLNENVQPLWGIVPMTPETAPQVAVPEEHAEAARRIAEQFDAAQQTLPRDGGESPESPDAADDEDSVAWPSCPNCGAVRFARCPVCGEVADSFRAADAAPRSANVPPDLPGETNSGPSPPTHVCSTCDEPMTPILARHCPKCAHDFGDGIELEQTPSPERETRPFNFRALLVFVAIVGFIAATIYYLGQLVPKEKPKPQSQQSVKASPDFATGWRQID